MFNNMGLEDFKPEGQEHIEDPYPDSHEDEVTRFNREYEDWAGQHDEHYGNPFDEYIYRKQLDLQEEYAYERQLDLQDEYAQEMARGLIHTRATPEQIRTSWETVFTSPAEHHPDKFCYLVHGINPQSHSEFKEKVLIPMDTYDTSQDIDLLHEPDRIVEKYGISCSVIDQEHSITYGDAGFVLQAPIENITFMRCTDAGSLSTEVLEPGLVMVEELLRHTSPDSINEVKIKGKTDAGQASITAIWVKVNAKGEPLDPKLFSKLASIAFARTIPIIRIVRQS